MTLLVAYLVSAVLAVWFVFFVVADQPPYGYQLKDPIWLLQAPLSGGFVLGVAFVGLPWSLLILLGFLPTVLAAKAYFTDKRGEWPLFLAFYTVSWLILCGSAALIWAFGSV